MVFSSTIRNAMSLAGSWLVAAAIVIGGIVYFDEIKSVAGAVLGVPGVGQQTALLDQAKRASRSDKRARSRDTSTSGSVVELRPDRHGQYLTQVDINGSDTRVLVDTGATAVALTAEDAEAAGIFPSPAEFTVRISTANGIGRAAPVMLDHITIGNITVHNVRALVNEPGTLQITLLGMTFLNSLSRVDIGGGRMILAD